MKKRKKKLAVRVDVKYQSKLENAQWATLGVASSKAQVLEESMTPRYVRKIGSLSEASIKAINKSLGYYKNGKGDDK